MNKRLIWLGVGALVLLAAVLGWQRFNAPPAGNLAGSSLGGKFALINQAGKPVTEADFAGQYRLMYFGYTFCPDICPNDVGVIARGLVDFEKAQPDRGARVTPIFITVDPERDDVAAMQAFTSAFHPRLAGLTGTPAAIDAARKTFGIYARKVTTSDPANYLVDHFAIIYLFGPDGATIAFLPHGSTAAEVTAMLETYVR